MNKLVFGLTVSLMVMAAGCKKDSAGSVNPVTTPVPAAVFNTDLTYGSVTDVDGNVYKTIIIGTQTWMAENLRTTKYKDGVAIPKVTSGTEWKNLSAAAYCAYNNTTRIDSISVYGYLYNWYAVNTGKLAPTGWHVPSKTEWETLIGYLGGIDVAGGKMKEVAFLHWETPNTDATNASGFTGLPAGERYAGIFGHIGFDGCFWSTTIEGTTTAWGRNISNILGASFQDGDNRTNGWSVRCIKD
jgi:uncharacterized protein (TIGR02145 family)